MATNLAAQETAPSVEVEKEQSVKPGVNKGYKDPELNVDKMIKRFEMESREVYLNRKEIVAACDIKPGDVVADVGAGTGVFTRLFTESVGDEGWVYAVDIAPRLVGHIVSQAEESGCDERHRRGVCRKQYQSACQ